MSVSHLAGNAVRIGCRVIQRCLICGAVIIDEDHEHAMRFPVGAWIQVYTCGGVECSGQIGRTDSPNFRDESEFPIDHCLDLVERGQ